MGFVLYAEGVGHQSPRSRSAPLGYVSFNHIGTPTGFHMFDCALRLGCETPLGFGFIIVRYPGCAAKAATLGFGVKPRSGLVLWTSGYPECAGVPATLGFGVQPLRGFYLRDVVLSPTFTSTIVIVSFPKMSTIFMASLRFPGAHSWGGLLSSNDRFFFVRNDCHSFSKT